MDSLKDSQQQLRAKEIVSPSLIKRPPPNVDWSEYSKFGLGLDPEWQYRLINTAVATESSSKNCVNLPPIKVASTSDYSTFDLGRDSEWEWISYKSFIYKNVQWEHSRKSNS